MKALSTSACESGWFVKGLTSFPASSRVLLPAQHLCQPEPSAAPVPTPDPELLCHIMQEALGPVQGQLWVPYGQDIPCTYARSISEARRGAESVKLI